MRILPRVSLVMLSLLCLPTSGAARSGQPVLHWLNGRHALDALPDTLPAAARSAVEAWGPFAADEDYGLDLSDDGRVLLVSDLGDSMQGKSVELIQSAIELFDKELPPAPVASEGGSGRPIPASKSDEIPEDPEGPPPGWDPPKMDEPAPDYTWGSGSIEPDRETIVLIILRNEDDYALCLDHLASLQEYLKEWVVSAREQLGFVLEQPLVGAYVLSASGQEEWNPDNELVNRMGQLLLLRRFGQQPNWIVQGWAWWCEFALLNGVYCFPYRDEFVYATEHTGWDKVVEKRLEERGKSKKKTLSFKDFAGWKRGAYSAMASRYAWAVIDDLIREHPGRLNLALDDLRRFRDEDNREDTSDTTWQRKQGYEVPVKRQREKFEARFGKSFLSEIHERYTKRR